jgi:hypothetical protein
VVTVVAQEISSSPFRAISTSEEDACEPNLKSRAEDTDTGGRGVHSSQDIGSAQHQPQLGRQSVQIEGCICYKAAPRATSMEQEQQRMIVFRSARLIHQGRKIFASYYHSNAWQGQLSPCRELLQVMVALRFSIIFLLTLSFRCSLQTMMMSHRNSRQQSKTSDSCAASAPKTLSIRFGPTEQPTERQQLFNNEMIS